MYTFLCPLIAAKQVEHKNKVFYAKWHKYHWHRNGGGCSGCQAPRLEKRGASTLFGPPPPLFMVHLSLPCPQYINLSAAIP